jgi:hypothetical protein
MAKIWRNRIIAETQLFSKCPARYKDDVEALLRADVASGEITAEKFTELTGLEY